MKNRLDLLKFLGMFKIESHNRIFEKYGNIIEYFIKENFRYERNLFGILE